MATALLKAVTAIGLKTTAFLQSLFLFPFNTVLQAVHYLPGFRQTKQQQPLLPCSTTTTSGAAASSSTPGETVNNDNDNNHNNNTTDDNNNEVAGDGARNNDSEMTTAPSSSSAASAFAPVPKIVPALPRAPLASRENRSPTKTSSIKPDAAAQLSDKLSRLDLDETETAAEQAPSAAASLQDVVNGSGSSVSDAGTGNQAALVAAQQSGPRSMSSLIGDDAAAAEVTRALPVPLTHTVSQTSRPKETTTMQLDGVTVQIQARDETPEQAAERAMHSRFMREALDMARLALKTNETPVGCVLVYKNRVIARGMNATNVTRNGTRHAELMAISALLSYSPASDLEPAATASPEKGAAARTPLGDKTNQTLTQSTEETSTWGDVDPQDGHLYPYGQKLHPSPRVDPSVITECTLYVTVEPCVMCASLLRQFGVKKVYFGAVNDKFGGTGGVFRIHKNSPCSMASAPPSPAPQNGKGIARPVLERRPASAADVAVAVPVSVPVPVAEEEPQQQQEQQQQQQQNPMTMMGGEQPTAYGNGDGLVTISQIEVSSLPGDGGNIERGYEAEGGWGRDEAVTLLRQFYVQENNRAPVPRKKEGRAARLAAMMERDGHAAGPVGGSGVVPKSQSTSGAGTPAVQEEAVGEVVEEAAEAVAA